MAYIKGQWEWIACQTGIIILINLILLTSTPLAKTLGEVFYLDLLAIFVAGAGYFFHFRRMNKAYIKIRQTMFGGQDIGRLFSQLSDAGEDSVPGISLMNELLEYERKNFSLKENDYQQRMNDLKDYLTQSVHDLKVNLSVCEMVVNRLENETDIANKLLFQIEQMKFRINQALFITRANHYSEDIVSENVDLEQVVKEAISDNAEFFINKGISIQNDLRPYHFISDKKWIRYIVAQILNNSSKYTDKKGEITIFSRKMNGDTTCI
jgi:signal transduction histidine kinase